MSVTSGTSCLLSGRPLLRKWIKWIGQPKTVSPEFYESSLSKIYPSGHWLGCDARSSWVKGCLTTRNTTVGVQWVHKSRTEPSMARSLLRSAISLEVLHNPTMWVTLPSPTKGAESTKKPLKATTEGVVNLVRSKNSIVATLKMSIFLKR